MNKKLHAPAFGAAGAIVAALVMLLLGIAGNLGIYTGGVAMMTQWHLFFSLSPVGIIAGMAEAALSTFVLLWAVAAIYNKLT